MKKLIFISMLFVLATTTAFARTWYVELDGSGDFTDLQSASEAVASGDTIRVGPGHFSEPAESTCIPGDYWILMTVQVAELTIIGSGPDETILGPEEPWEYGTFPRFHGIVIDGRCGARHARIQDMAFVNLTGGVCGQYITAEIPDLDTSTLVHNCTFDDVWMAITLDGTHNTVTDCTNNSSIQFSTLLSTFISADIETMEVRRCESHFTNFRSIHIFLGRMDVMEISDCVFSSNSSFDDVSIMSATLESHFDGVSVSGAFWGIWVDGLNTYIPDSTNKCNRQVDFSLPISL